MKLAVGCPVAHREWILPKWFEHVRAATASIGVEPLFVFVCDRRDRSWACIETEAPDATLVECTTTRSGDIRSWDPVRYLEMVGLRNSLLGAVRGIAPDEFLSLDSDVLLHPDQLGFLLETRSRFDAVGGRCYMTVSGTRFPSWGELGRDGSLRRHQADGVFPVDVIMAIKLMGPSAYNVNYRLDRQGEDIGWSKACREAGLKLGWDGRVAAKHVLGPHLLHPVDARVGF